MRKKPEIPEPEVMFESNNKTYWVGVIILFAVVFLIGAAILFNVPFGCIK